jgi:transcription antitermination factor NusG
MASKGWFALYTKSRFEKQANRLLQQQGFETYLPLIITTRKWSDRLKKVEVPLLNSYVFVIYDPNNPLSYYNILETPGVVRFISFEGKPVRIPDNQIDSLRKLSQEGYEMEPLVKPIPLGSEVEIKRGPLKGIKGLVVRSPEGANQLLVIRLDVLDKNIQVKLPPGMIV